MAIEIKGVEFSYGNKKVLKGIDLNLSKGKLIGVLGPNGCGKSTLLKVILKYLRSSKGSIKILGEDLNNFSQKKLAKKMALLPQSSVPTSSMKVEDFVLMGRLPHLKNSWSGYSKRDYSISREYIKETDIEYFKKREISNLSGGEYQRVLLARALTQEPEILLLDEPTSAMDLNHAVDLMETVKRKMKIKGITSIAVIHDLNLASLFCDEIIFIKDGKVSYTGKPKDVFTEEVLEEVYNLKSKIIGKDTDRPFIIPKLRGEVV